MAEYPISLIESNDEIVDIQVLQNGLPYDLTGTTLRFYVKPKPQTADGSDRVSTLTSEAGQLVIEDAVQGLVTAFIPRSVLTNTGPNWYRLDVHKGGTIRTASYGVLTIIDV